MAVSTVPGLSASFLFRFHSNTTTTTYDNSNNQKVDCNLYIGLLNPPLLVTRS